MARNRLIERHDGVIRSVAASMRPQATDICPGSGLMELSFAGRMRVMAAPRKYPDELRERATRMAVEAGTRPPGHPAGALARVGKQLGITPETLQNRVTQAEIDAGGRPGATNSDAERMAALERENRELRQANAILKSVSALFTAELDCPQR
jgi:transposase